MPGHDVLRAVGPHDRQDRDLHAIPLLPLGVGHDVPGLDRETVQRTARERRPLEDGRHLVFEPVAQRTRLFRVDDDDRGVFVAR